MIDAETSPTTGRARLLVGTWLMGPEYEQFSATTTFGVAQELAGDVEGVTLLLSALSISVAELLRQMAPGSETAALDVLARGWERAEKFAAG